MLIASFPTLLLATVLAGPAIWHAVVTQDLDPLTALIRYLIAIPVAALMLAFVRALTNGYERKNSSPLRVKAVTGSPLLPSRPSGQAPSPTEPVE